MPVRGSIVAPERTDPADGNAGISLRSYLDESGEALKNLPAHWVRCEIQDLAERTTPKGTWRNLTIVESRNGQIIARADVSASPWEWQRIQVALDAAGVEIRKGVTAMLRLQPEMSKFDRLVSRLLDVDTAFLRGELSLKADAIREELRAKGTWDLQRHHPSPFWFEHVAVIAPPGAAGLGDVEKEMRRLEAVGVKFLRLHATFQSNEAPASIIAALREAFEAHKVRPLCGVLLVRGGGSASDFAHLCDGKLATWVARYPVPVFTGIGHEKDVCILDEVAHRNCGTPSKAIEHVKGTVLAAANAAAVVIANIRSEARRAEAAASSAVRLALFSALRAAGSAPIEAYERVADLKAAVRTSALAAVDQAATRCISQAAEAREVAAEIVARTESDVRAFHAALLPNARRQTEAAGPKVLATLTRAQRGAGDAVARAAEMLSRVQEAVRRDSFAATDLADRGLADMANARAAFAARSLQRAEAAVLRLRPEIPSLAADAASAAQARVVASRNTAVAAAGSALSTAELRLRGEQAGLREAIAAALERPTSEILLRAADVRRAPEALLAHAARRTAEARERGLFGATEAVRRAEMRLQAARSALRDAAQASLKAPTSDVRMRRAEIERAPAALLDEAIRRVAETKARGLSDATEAIRRVSAEVNLISARVDGVDPRRIMRSGYAVLRDPATGRSVRSVDSARALPQVVAELHDGALPLVPVAPGEE
jgi:exodeoxyribonuclease VII large subunit